MTPFEIDILMHYHCRATDHEVVFENPPIWAETRKWFLDSGLLMKMDGGATAYHITPRGTAMVNAICSLPLPVQVWIMPEASK